ncbi:SURF1 family cytochrome oxidase biogenesis protein [Nocardioides pantholopis]|uniref:SURF1 family cytochrome oxidase biogenesis protein n=1 Tax=Nocardioides pantholopis TaxID=2483798 RepID=UPI0019D0ED5C|nr:SURF1 family protein [Nocardioides pantholopis]
MRSISFLLSRRWILFLLAVLLVGVGTWWLGEWQFDRLEERKERNEVVRANEALHPTPVDEVLATAGDVDSGDEWRVIGATGVYAPEDTVVVRYATSPNEDGSGVDVIVPLVTADGTALLVNRGWMMREDVGGDIGEIPPPPTGEVTVTGYVRGDGSGSSTRVVDGSTRAVDSSEIGEAIGRDTYGGWVELREENGEPAEGLVAAELPGLDNGPHFFYGLQWWFFGLLALAGFLYLAYDEWRHLPERRQAAKADRPPTKAEIRKARRAAAKRAAGSEKAPRRDDNAGV